jgi:hypothetical protein
MNGCGRAPRFLKGHPMSAFRHLQMQPPSHATLGVSCARFPTLSCIGVMLGLGGGCSSAPQMRGFTDGGGTMAADVITAVEGSASETDSGDSASLDAPGGGESGNAADAGDAGTDSDTGDADVADADGVSNCVGATIQGTVTLTNSLDVDLLAAYVEVTGDLVIDGVGLANVVLPNLCRVGGSITDFTGGNSASSDLRTLDMPALVEVGSAFFFAAQLDELTVPLLRSVGAAGCVGACAQWGSVAVSLQGSFSTLSFPALSASPIVYVTTSADALTLNIPGLSAAPMWLTAVKDITVNGALLRSSTDFELSGAGKFTVNAPLQQTDKLGLGGGPSMVVSIPSLISAGSVALGDGQISLDSLSTITTGSLALAGVSGLTASFQALTSAPSISLAGPATMSVPQLAMVTGGDLLLNGTIAASLPSLTTIKGNLTASPGMTAPALTAVGGDVSLTGTMPVNLPSLTTINGSLTESVGLTADSLLTVGGDVTVKGTTAVSLPSLTAIPGTLAASQIPSFSAPHVASIGSSAIFWGCPVDSFFFPPGPQCDPGPHGLGSIDLTALVSVGGEFQIVATTLSELDLPALASASISLGSTAQTPGCSSEDEYSNTTLVSIVAPNWTSGSLSVDDPVFPGCRAEALAMQVGKPLTVGGECPLATSPCP